MAIVAPNDAPDDMPVVYGSAREFSRVLCITTPATANPMPAMIATATRGDLRVTTM